MAFSPLVWLDLHCSVSKLINRGCQAVIADTVQTRGQNEKSDEQSHAKRHEGSALFGHDAEGNGVPIPSREGKKRCRMHGGTNPGAPIGNCNAWRHGAFSVSSTKLSLMLKSIA